MESKLLDMRDCASEQFKEIHNEMMRIKLLQQPTWIRPFLLKSSCLQRWLSYNHWGREWEYPWAIMVSDLRDRLTLRTIDVGGGQ